MVFLNMDMFFVDIDNKLIKFKFYIIFNVFILLFNCVVIDFKFEVRNL